MKKITVRLGEVSVEVSDPADLPAVMAAMGLATSAPQTLTEADLSVRHKVKGLVIPDCDPDDDPEPVALASVSTLAPVERIAVQENLLEVLNTVLAFPEGITIKGINTLLAPGAPKAMGNRVYRLKLMGLVEKVDGHWLWRATQRARDAKLIAA